MAAQMRAEKVGRTLAPRWRWGCQMTQACPQNSERVHLLCIAIDALRTALGLQIFRNEHVIIPAAAQ